MFRFNKTIIREPTSLKLQYWRQFNNEVFNWRQYCNFSEAQNVGSLIMVLLNRNM